jgi:3-oxoadipate enol-lactonase
MPEAFIRTDHISYDVAGPVDGVVVLFAHSIGTTRALWEAQSRALVSQGFRVVRYDARGHGSSAAPAGDYTIDRLGGDALAVLDGLGIERAHVVGLSLGGLTAMWLGVHAPARVGRLVLANTAARVGTAERWVERIAQVRANGMAGIVEPTMTRWFSESFRGQQPSAVAAYRAMLAGCSPIGYAGCCAVLRDADLREDIAKINAPTLIIAGDQDQATTLVDAEVMRSRISGAALLTLPAAHLSNVEQPAAFTEAVRQFLEA